MNNQVMRTAGVIAGIVVVLGVLAIGAQYWSSMSGGASAQVVDLERLPTTISMSKEDYVTVRSLMDRFTAASDLATKNQIFKEIRGIFDGLAK